MPLAYHKLLSLILDCHQLLSLILDCQRSLLPCFLASSPAKEDLLTFSKQIVELWPLKVWSIPSMKKLLYDKPILTVDMTAFPPPIRFFSQLHLGIVSLLRRCQGEISEEILKMVFSLFTPILIIKRSKIQESCICVPFNLLILISINVFATKVKLHK